MPVAPSRESQDLVDATVHGLQSRLKARPARIHSGESSQQILIGDVSPLFDAGPPPRSGGIQVRSESPDLGVPVVLITGPAGAVAAVVLPYGLPRPEM